MLEQLKQKVFKSNIDLVKYGLVTFAWGDSPMQKELLDKHYLRKHGANAYYGQ